MAVKNGCKKWPSKVTVKMVYYFFCFFLFDVFIWMVYGLKKMVKRMVYGVGNTKNTYSMQASVLVLWLYGLQSMFLVFCLCLLGIKNTVDGLTKSGKMNGSTVRYSMIWYDMIWYNIIWYGMVWCAVVWCGDDNLCEVCMCTHTSAVSVKTCRQKLLTKVANKSCCFFVFVCVFNLLDYLPPVSVKTFCQNLLSVCVVIQIVNGLTKSEKLFVLLMY